jgi:hypothetical protein
MEKAFTCKLNDVRNLKSFLCGMNKHDTETSNAKSSTSCTTAKPGLRIILVLTTSQKIIHELSKDVPYQAKIIEKFLEV